MWNENARLQRDIDLGCGFTWYVWEDDTLAFECRDRDGKGHTTHYVFEPGTFVPVAQAVSNHVVELLPQPVYVFPYDIDKDPVWQHKPMPKPFDAFAWYQCDHLGTPMELTGEDGEIAWQGTYKAWGLAEEKRSEQATWADIRNPLRFQGQYWDVETGLHYNRHRYYDPIVGRFIGKDPIGFEGGLNFYQYAPNPISWFDPLGLARKKCDCDFPEGSVGQLRATGQKDAHHVIQDAAVRELPGYNTNHAPGVRLEGPSTKIDTPHYAATQIQRQPGGGTYGAERRIGYKSLRAAGYSAEESRSEVLRADKYFDSIGVTNDTPTRTVGNRRKIK